jgi:hypothetical protein
VKNSSADRQPAAGIVKRKDNSMLMSVSLHDYPEFHDVLQGLVIRAEGGRFLCSVTGKDLMKEQGNE